MIITGHLSISNEALVKKCVDITQATEFRRSPPGIFTGVIDSRTKSKFGKNIIDPHNWDEFLPIIPTINELSNHMPITNSWFNITEYRGEMQAHVHPLASKYVFLYYVNCNATHPQIEFLINKEWVSYNCVSGDWLFFPKDTMHRVKPNTGTPDRISISVNL